MRFYSCLTSDQYPNLKIFARKLITIIGSTYISEQTFLRMKFTKSKLRSQMTDEHLHAVLKISGSSLQQTSKKW